MGDKIRLQPVYRDEPDLDRLVAGLLRWVEELSEASEPESEADASSEGEADLEVA